ncbi:MAG: valyl-tRNA synthetase, valyl-tRNA synthetase [Candidatus Peregrinibacteria bacterium GW2011_GWF2_33_10]|nr:MAG: valyl-tRNA synthetase, valyl-tRNA synthetase [Candidatus Peregrinibacteria bacterium GW2011_GWF2_33_10]OGJ44855.1 MAG: valine--tRNA ligase [Candidatus Peregrinibacteria bacterium RIFOXYA2_FULL_33_21]OGJ47140.1 MAG: valine--tRNA ligase [Candidatus Peregrinibacteria bacterium RIFOXYA12_FULL_33_12]OGJ50541.1 MAG: valine--tRNA ligase [Candidatus Peregrinibacteria bacterium RIFOXYB2_FULL_33_20]
MPDIAKVYDAKKYEDSIYQMWDKLGLFSPEIDPSKKPFTIAMPPPNATGTLHLGHATMLALEDLMVRYKRMAGFETLWLPGTDHAAIATQNKVEGILAKEHKTRHDLGRERFLEKVKEYVASSQDTIKNQVKKMGSSCDWSREAYTFSDKLSFAVNTVFKRMYEDGLVYRGNRIVNWCCRCHSTLADDEVSYKDENGKLYWIKYGPFELATTRPETKLGDTAVAVHPDDFRYKNLIGKKFNILGVLGEFEITVVADELVDREFGSGAVKVTPSHSFMDFEIAQRHNLPFKQIINEEGKMMDNCGKYAGMTTLECRKAIVEDMKNMGILLKVEDYSHKISICYRCGTVIEPLTSEQWFINVNKKLSRESWQKKDNDLLKDLEGTSFSLKDIANHVVRSGQVKIIPDRFNNTYFHWMENLRDWCISRQIWWGHRVPVYYCHDCHHIMVELEPMSVCNKCSSVNLKQDEDTLDTWFSSALWTFSTLGWPEQTQDLKYFHPTQVMETGYDILFFWVARMIIMSTYAVGEIPFETVYLHGLVRDKEGRKMSKSLGNGIDPLDMIDKFGADAVRLSLLIGTTPGNDMRLYEEKISGYRNFVNKLWNAFRLVMMICENNAGDSANLNLADKWIMTETQSLVEEVTTMLDEYRFSDAGSRIYDFTWSVFCDWYLEISKIHPNPAVLKYVLDIILKLAHPFSPFVTEAVYQEIQGADPNSNILMIQSWPKPQNDLIFAEEAKQMETVVEVIKEIRSLRVQVKVEAVRKIQAYIYGAEMTTALMKKSEVIKRLANLSELIIAQSGQKIEKSISKFVGNIEIYLPLESLVDSAKERLRLKKEIERLNAYITALQLKLNNNDFTAKAPAHVVELEQQKLLTARMELNKIEEQLKEV